ncbi:MAG TPA: 4-(cytidine 5'-diphospho)-2-C-methyl-D-erythritol kinase [Ignavibacteria bacterium]|nr:4-(cytidine 5'-diphospho)-2-C-methyl-D-erythritol kinase [Ignavibacteria bacterium]
MPVQSLISNSKINTGLKILRKRNDGYHDLETIFYPLDLHDTIDIDIEPGHLKINNIHINSDSRIIPRNTANLCYTAVENFFAEFPQDEFYSIQIYIHKNIPLGGGLAGGSSNAASVIKFLASYFGLAKDENRDRIMKVALQTGSDVPFFLFERPCFASGRGEEIKPLDDFKLDYDILIVNPNVRISTKEAFESLNFKAGEERHSELRKVTAFDPSRLEIFQNDFEAVAFEMYPEIAQIKSDLLEAGAVFASLTGSGASTYGLFTPLIGDKKNNLKEYFSAKGYFTFLSELKNRQLHFQKEQQFFSHL